MGKNLLKEKQSILILSLDTLGDIVLRQPLFKELLDKGHKVTVLVRKGYETILPLLDERLSFVTVNVNPYIYESSGHKELLEECRNLVESIAPDIIVCAPFQRTFLDEWILKSFPGCRRIGFNGSCYPYLHAVEKEIGIPETELFDHIVLCDEKEAEVEKNRKLLAELTGNDMRTYKPEIKVPQNVIEDAGSVLKELGLEEGKFIVCCPGGIANVKIKAWPADKYAEVLSHIYIKHGLPALLIGLDSEKEIIEEVASKLKISGSHVKSWIGSGDDIRILLGLLASARMYIGNDTGPMHISAALGKPLLAVFGGGHWPRFIPAAEVGAVLTQELPCFYCRWAYCVFGNAPCVKMVTTDKVIEFADRILSGQISGMEIYRGDTMNDVSNEMIKNIICSSGSLYRQKSLDMQTNAFLESALEKERAIATERLELLYERGGEVIALQNKLLESEAVNRERIELINERGGEVIALQNKLLESEAVNRERIELINERGGEVIALRQRLSTFERLRETGGIGWFLELNSSRGGYSKITSGQGTPNLISVIIPVYNAEKFLEECIKSIWEQEPCDKEIEIIAVDDGSRDGSLKLLQELAGRSPVAMKVLQHPGGINRGVSATRNLGLNNATGEWVCMLDADDAWEPRKLKTQIEYANSHPEATAICSYGHNIDTEGKPCIGWTGGTIAGDYSSVLPQYNLTGDIYTFETLAQTCPLVNSTVMIKRHNFVEVGGYKENMSQQTEDWLMWAQLSIKFPIHLIKEPLIKYRIHQNSWTTRYCVEDLGETVKFEFFVELLYWMFTHDDENIRNKANWVYKKYFPFFVKPVAKFFKEVDSALQPYIELKEPSEEWLNIDRVKSVTETKQANAALNSEVARAKQTNAALNSEMARIKQANAALENRMEKLRKIPGYRLSVKVAKMVGMIKN